MSKIERLIREELDASESNPDAPQAPEVEVSRPNRVRSTVYSIRFNAEEVAAIQELAIAASLPASTLVRSWIVERIKSEQGETGDVESELQTIQLHLTHLQHQIVKNSWSEVRKHLDIDEQTVARERVRLRLAVLREQLGRSQIELAELLATSQPDVTQLERGEDLQLSSIAKYVHALGGQLQVNAVVGNTTYRLTDDVGESVSAKP